MPFLCSICGEESTRICARCTKDACTNHLCDKCQRCSDCCECEVVLAENPASTVSARSVFPKHEAPANTESEPDAPHPPPDPDPVPDPANP